MSRQVIPNDSGWYLSDGQGQGWISVIAWLVYDDDGTLLPELWPIAAVPGDVLPVAISRTEMVRLGYTLRREEDA